jgi:hypothetical protein
MKRILILNNFHSEIDLLNNLLKLKRYKMYAIGNRITLFKKIKHRSLDCLNISKVKKLL